MLPLWPTLDTGRLGEPMGNSTAKESAMVCPMCGLAIATPTVMAYEPPVFDARRGAFCYRIHVGPNDVEYEMHVMTCG